MAPQTVAEVVAQLDATEPETAALYGTLAPVYEFVVEHAGVPETQFSTVRGTLPEATSTVVEYACGTGGLLARLAAHYDVVGLDRSRQQLSLARRKTDAPLVQGDVRRPPFDEQFDAALLLGHSLGHLTGEGDVEQCFDAVARSLAPGGVFLFDCHSLASHDEPVVRENVGDGDRFHVTHEAEIGAADETGLVERRDAFTVRDRDVDRTVTAETGTYTFRAHEPAAVAELLEAAGFHVGDVRSREESDFFLARRA